MTTSQISQDNLDSLNRRRNKANGRFGHAFTLESDVALENISPAMEELGLVSEFAIAEYVAKNHKRTVLAEMNRQNTRNKNTLVDEGDLMAESIIGVLDTARKNRMQGAENVIGYITNVVRNVTKKHSAITKNPMDLRAKREVDEIIALQREAFGSEPTREQVDEIVRKVRASYDEGSHKPSQDFYKPPTITYSMEASQEYAEEANLNGSDITTAALLNRGNLEATVSLAVSGNPEMSFMNKYSTATQFDEYELNRIEKMANAASESIDAAEDAKGQMAGVTRRMAMQVFSKKFNLPSSEGVAIPQGKVTKYRKIIATPEDLMEVCNAWQQGELDEKGEVFFSPWGETTEEEKDNLVHFFTKGLSTPSRSLKYWQESLTSVNTMQIKRDKAYAATAAENKTKIEAGV